MLEECLESIHRRHKMAAETRSDHAMIHLVDMMEIVAWQNPD